MTSSQTSCQFAYYQLPYFLPRQSQVYTMPFFYKNINSSFCNELKSQINKLFIFLIFLLIFLCLVTYNYLCFLKI